MNRYWRCTKCNVCGFLPYTALQHNSLTGHSIEWREVIAKTKDTDNDA